MGSPLTKVEPTYEFEPKEVTAILTPHGWEEVVKGSYREIKTTTGTWVSYRSEYPLTEGENERCLVSDMVVKGYRYVKGAITDK